MIQFFVLLIFTLIAGSVLYFYPPNIPYKLKMTLLGLAFLLASSGLVVLGNLSYGLALAAILAIAFVASYVAEKRMNLVPATAGQTEIVLSFSEEESVRETSQAKVELESAVTAEELRELEEITDEEVVTNASNEERVLEIQNFESLDVIDLLDMELDDIIEEKVEIEMVDPVQELEMNHQLAELTDDEFAFLTETREIYEENVTEIALATDIENKESLLQRSVLLEELDSIEEDLKALELSDTNISEIITEDIFAEVEELSTEEVHTLEEPIILEEILITEEPVQIEAESDAIEKPIEETSEEKIPENVVELVEEVANEEQEIDGLFMQDEFETEVVEHEEEVMVNPSVPDMEGDMQDMLLNTLFSYQEHNDHESYQVMAETILNQSLSDKDYYLFSKLLIDFYAVSNEFARVDQLLNAMEARLSHYPVIAEELERYKDIFLVKQ